MPTKPKRKVSRLIPYNFRVTAAQLDYIEKAAERLGGWRHLSEAHRAILQKGIEQDKQDSNV